VSEFFETTPSWLPEGYKYEGGYIYQNCVNAKDGTSHDTLVYMGYLAVIGWYVEYFSDNKIDPVIHYEVEFDAPRGEKRKVRIPAAKMGIAMKAAPILLAAGAIVSDKNIKSVCHYLMMSFNHQKETIREVDCTRQLGIIKNVLVTPCRSVGNMEYFGPPLEFGNDQEIYKRTLVQEVINWGPSAWPIWFCLGASLVSPFINNLTPRGSPLRRNPIIGLIGPSNYGKTTTAFFANGVWGDPCSIPFYISASNKNSIAGQSQTIEFGNGLPLIMDESHKLSATELGDVVYTRANRMGRAMGSLLKTPEAPTIKGLLLFCGEVFKILDVGNLNRIIIINVDVIPPLGIRGIDSKGVVSEEGQRRSEILSKTWTLGSGFLGPDMYEFIFSSMEMEEGFKKMIDEFVIDPKFTTLNGMAGIVAIIQTQIIFLFHYLQIPIPPWIHDIPIRIKECLEKQGKSHETDPSLEVFDKIRSMVGQAMAIPIIGIENGTLYKIREETVAWTYFTKDGDRFTAVLLNTQALKQYAGTEIQKYFGAWKSLGLLKPSKTGENTLAIHNRSSGSGKVRSILLNFKDKEGSEDE
jgi:hypothetical protein